MKNSEGFISIGILIAIILGVVVVGGGAYYVMNKNPQPQVPTSQEQTTNTQTKQSSIKFNAIAGATFTLAVGQTATDGADGVTIKLKSVTGGRYPSTIVNVVSASSTVEAGLAETAKTWGLTQDEYVPGAGVGSYLSWSAKWGDMQWHDTNSPTGVIKIKVTSIDPISQTVMFTISTTPSPSNNG